VIAAWAILSGQNSPAPIHFQYRPIAFRLENCETLRRPAPETMAGGVALFDYNNHGRLDIFFANGADIASLKRGSPKDSNPLFENGGKGRFTDVTEKTGLAGAGFDDGDAIGDYATAARISSSPAFAREPPLSQRGRPVPRGYGESRAGGA
jgi:enediyne biosynthesis protein E4